MNKNNPRRFACLVIATCVALLSSLPAAVAQITYKRIPGDPIRIESGLVAGTFLPSGVKAYFGIPFAAPPVRENRWREPQPVKAWTGVLTANRLSGECVQTLRSSDINHYFGEEAAVEDCLYLNVWAPPTASAGAKLPVIVWVYGGGFTVGSSSSPVYSGEQLAKRGVLYVSFNYRVGLFGFIAHPEATRESDHNASGNWGFLDQVAALKWVNRNIDKFGGDPHNVTVAGQSAGSLSVTDLQASPLTKGLFQKAIGMSGSTLAGVGADSVTLAQGEEQGLKLQNALKAKSLAHMRTFSSDKVVAAGQAAQVRSWPIIDGYFLPKSPKEIFAAGQQNDVAILVGSTSNDIGTGVEIRNVKTAAEYRAAAAKMYRQKADEFLSLFPGSNDADARASAEQAAIGSGMGLGGWSWARAQATTGKAPAYLYLFSRTQPYSPGVVFSDHDPATAGAYHMGDVPYWLQTQDAFNLFRTTRDWTSLDRELANKMSDVILSFAKTGNPSTPAVTVPRFDPANQQRVDFGDTIRVVKVNAKGMEFISANSPDPAAATAAAVAASVPAAPPTPASSSGTQSRPTY